MYSSPGSGRGHTLASIGLYEVKQIACFVSPATAQHLFTLIEQQQQQPQVQFHDVFQIKGRAGSPLDFLPGNQQLFTIRHCGPSLGRGLVVINVLAC